MRLEALKLLERVQERVPVVEPDHKADRDLMVFQVIQERAAIGVAVERPADRVHDEAGLVPRRIDLPQFLDADRIGLRVGAVAQVKALDQRLGQRAAAAFGEQGLAADQLDPGV